MFKFIDRIMHPPVEDIQAKSLAIAARELEEHVQAQEYHDAMIGMYAKRLARLSGKSTTTKDPS